MLRPPSFSKFKVSPPNFSELRTPLSDFPLSWKRKEVKACINVHTVFYIQMSNMYRFFDTLKDNLTQSLQNSELDTTGRGQVANSVIGFFHDFDFYYYY